MIQPMAKKMHRALLCLLMLFLCLGLHADETDTYCYGTLDADEQIAYNVIFDCITHMVPAWNCGSMSQATVQRAYDSLMMDRPELYWTDSYQYVTSFVNNTITGHRVEFIYNKTRSEIASINAEIEASIIDMFRDIGRIDPSYETVKAVYEYMARNYSYDATNLDQSLYSVMIHRSGVCASFSRSFQFIMQILGIPCTVVYGRLTRSEGVLGTTLGHEWNLIQLDGKWYHVDVTSAVSVYNGKEVNYRFLCATTEDILKTHVIENLVPVPECNSLDYEFFRYHGLCVDAYSREALASAMLKAVDMGLAPMARFSNYRAYCDAIDDLFTREGIFQAITDATGLSFKTVGYRLDEDQYILRLDI